MTTKYERTWEHRRAGGRSVSDAARTSYYGLPTIHKPHWKWLIIWYFFLGGISAASYVLATLADLLGRSHDARRVARAGRYLSLATLIPSPILLILDLGRPERFFHMLYLLKLRSPMSVGTWGLTIFGGFCGLSALIQAAQDGLLAWARPLNRLLLALPRRAIGLVGSAFGFFVGGYTGVLLSATAVPLWARNFLLLGPLFLTSALSTATAAVTLVLALGRRVNRHALHVLERFDRLALAIELGLILAVRLNAGAVIGRPLRQGRLGAIWRWGVIGAGIGAPGLIQVLGRIVRAPTRLVAILASSLVLIGGFLLRYVVVMAGRASADDPEASFAFTRHPRPRA